MKRYDVAALGLYGLLTLLLALPLVLNINTALAGQDSDVYHNPWADWWTKKALTEGLDFYYTDYMFYPQGTSLVFHSFSHVNTFIILFLEPLVGYFAAYNIAILLAYVLSGFNMYLLVNYLTGCRPAAFVAGLVFAFHPYHIFESSHPVLVSTQWMPLFALALMRALRETGLSRVRQMVLATLWFLLTALSSWHLMIMLTIWAAFYLLYGLLCERSEWAPRAFRSLVLLAVVIGLTVTPFLWPMIRELVTSDVSHIMNTRSDLENDLLSFIVPNRRHPLIGSFVETLNLHDDISFTGKRTAYLGYISLGLAISGVAAARRKSRFWLLAGLVFLVLSLGSWVTVNRVPLHSFPLPWAVPVVSILRNPIRLNVLLFFCLAVLVGYGGCWLHNKVTLRSRTLAPITLVLIAGSVLVEYLIYPFPISQLSYSPFWHQLAQEEGDFAVADFPRGNRHEKYYMFCQILHGKKTISGRPSRSRQDADNLSDPLLQELGVRRAPDPTLNIDQEFAKLDTQDIRYVILHKHFFEPDEIEDWRAWFAFRPYYEDEYLLVFRTAPRYGEDFQFTTELGDGIGIIDASVSSRQVGLGGSLDVEIVWGTRDAPHQDWMVRLALLDRTGQAAQQEDFVPFPGWPTSEWGYSAVARGLWTLQVDPYIPSDTYTVTLGLVNSATGEQAGESVVLGSLDVQTVERVFEVPDVETESEAVFGGKLRLLGYDLRDQDSQIVITLHWKALQRMDVAYKFFVHVVDLESGQLVTQVDVMPRGWTYPTFWWEEGEVVSDELLVQLEDVPPGSYRLFVGVYDPDAGQRLTITGQPPSFPVDEGRLALEQTIVR